MFFSPSWDIDFATFVTHATKDDSTGTWGLEMEKYLVTKKKYRSFHATGEDKKLEWLTRFNIGQMDEDEEEYTESYQELKDEAMEPLKQQMFQEGKLFSKMNRNSTQQRCKREAGEFDGDWK